MSEQPKKKSGIFSSLSDDLLGQVVNKVKDIKDRKSFSLVCKQWLKVEGLDRSWLIISGKNPWLGALTRFPNIVNLVIWNCKTHTDLEFIAHTCPKVQSIEIGCRDKKQKVDGGNLSPKGLCALGEGCPKLAHVDIIGQNAVGNSGIAELVRSAHNLESLVLQHNELVSDEALRAIGSTSSISILELVNCYNITDDGLAFLANGSTSKTLKKLIFDSAPEMSKITDTGVMVLRKMCCLETKYIRLFRFLYTLDGLQAPSLYVIVKEMTLMQVSSCAQVGLL